MANVVQKRIVTKTLARGVNSAFSLFSKDLGSVYKKDVRKLPPVSFVNPQGGECTASPFFSIWMRLSLFFVYAPARNHCEINSENNISCNWNEIFQEKNSKTFLSLTPLVFQSCCCVSLEAERLSCSLPDEGTTECATTRHHGIPDISQRDSGVAIQSTCQNTGFGPLV